MNAIMTTSTDASTHKSDGVFELFLLSPLKKESIQDNCEILNLRLVH